MFTTFWGGNKSFFTSIYVISLPSAAGHMQKENIEDYVGATRWKGHWSLNDCMDQDPPFTHIVLWCEWEINLYYVKPVRFCDYLLQWSDFVD